ncbi:MAG: hypothetical protein GY853_06235 [PVC group bacterium]|nr:hypothetical protein [PVC group bacterium]
MNVLNGFKKLLFWGMLCLSVFCFAATVYAVQTKITLKLLGVNPSKTNTQSMTLQAHLPKEVTPEDIIDRGDFNLTYDTQQGAYKVFGEYELAPGETIEREVTIKNIWLVSEAEIENLRKEINKTISFIKNTEFEERAQFLKQSIEVKLDKIIKRQNLSAANPQQHISNYRENLDLLEAAKNDLILARSFLTEGKRLPAITIWKVFFSVVGFLGVLATTLYIIWQRQAQMMKSSVKEDAAAKEEELAPEQYTAEEEQQINAEDIEDIMNKGE